MGTRCEREVFLVCVCVCVCHLPRSLLLSLPPFIPRTHTTHAHTQIVNLEINSHTFLDMAAALEAAPLIVTPEGGQSFNAVFARPGAVLIEIAPAVAWEEGDPGAQRQVGVGVGVGVGCATGVEERWCGLVGGEEGRGGAGAAERCSYALALAYIHQMLSDA